MKTVEKANAALGRRAWSLLLTAALLAAPSCKRYPESCAPPPQRRSDFGPDPAPRAVGDAVSMESPWIEKYLVKDIELSPGHARRWTFANPEMRFRLEGKANRKLVVNFVVHSETFKATGPLTVDFLVNGKSVGKMRCDRPGEHRLEAPVPDDLLASKPETRVAFQVDKYWVSPLDGARLGIVLVDVGFFDR